MEFTWCTIIFVATKWKNWNENYENKCSVCAIRIYLLRPYSKWNYLLMLNLCISPKKSVLSQLLFLLNLRYMGFRWEFLSFDRNWSNVSILNWGKCLNLLRFFMKLFFKCIIETAISHWDFCRKFRQNLFNDVSHPYEGCFTSWFYANYFPHMNFYYENAKYKFSLCYFTRSTCKTI